MADDHPVWGFFNWKIGKVVRRMLVAEMDEKGKAVAVGMPEAVGIIACDTLVTKDQMQY